MNSYVAVPDPWNARVNGCGFSITCRRNTETITDPPDRRYGLVCPGVQRSEHFPGEASGNSHRPESDQCQVVPAPDFQSGEKPWTSVQGQTRENALSCNYRVLALVKMPQAPQSTRTFFVTSTTAGRRALLQSDRMAQLLVDVLAENRRKKRFLLHEFVIMPNHFHLLLTLQRKSRWKRHYS